MLKHRKRILLVSVLLVFLVGLLWFLLPRNEPKYQGRYLSEWMDDVIKPNPSEADLQAVKRAVESIGTNGLPSYVSWLSQEPPRWKRYLYDNLPQQLKRNDSVADWLVMNVIRRQGYAQQSIFLLGTNAASAVPELNSLMRNGTNAALASMAIEALTMIGPESSPALRAAFADTDQMLRGKILWSIRWLSLTGYTNECLPTIIAALNDEDTNVRIKATNLLRMTSTNEILSIPQY